MKNIKKVNPVGRILSEAQCAYLAGMFDCDGAIMAIIEPFPSLKLKARVRIILKISQKKSYHLTIIRNFIKIGSVVKQKNTYEWIIRDKASTKWLLSQIVRFALVKRAQCRIALRILSVQVQNKQDLKKIALLADSLSKLNVRSKLRRLNNWAKIQELIPRND